MLDEVDRIGQSRDARRNILWPFLSVEWRRRWGQKGMASASPRPSWQTEKRKARREVGVNEGIRRAPGRNLRILALEIVETAHHWRPHARR